MSQKELLAARQLEVIRRGGRLPAFSLAGMQLLQMRRQGEPSADGVIASLRADARLSELALRLGRAVTPESETAPRTVEELVDSCGPVPMRIAALGISIVTCNRVGICTGFDYDGYWSRSLAGAAAAAEIAAELGCMHPAAAFGVALLSEAGRLVFASAFPEEYTRVLERARGEPRARLLELEQEAFGSDQAGMSVAFLTHLNFPPECCEALVALTIDKLSETRLYAKGVDPTTVFTAALRISDTFMGDAEGRTERWFELVNLRYRLQLEREAFNRIGDRTAQLWWEWGELLGVPTRHVPSFAELAHQVAQVEAGPSSESASDTQVEMGTERVPLKVLVVDDDPISLRIVKSNLVSQGHVVTTAIDGRLGLTAALEDMPQLIVADWEMPEMDGLELCRALRRFDAGRRIFFMLVTGREEESRMLEAFEAGVDDFIAKPFRPKPFLARVRGAMRMIALRGELELEKHRLRAELGRTKLLTRRLSMAALTDVLTDLPNRRHAIKRLSDDWANSERTGKPLSVVVVDIDHFKTINDAWGHDVGDQVLRETARALQENVRKGECACRLGGEEFLVICHDSDLSSAAQCADRIRAAVESAELSCGGFRGRLTISAGVAQKTEAVRDLDHLLKLADEATYAAKERGRNRIMLAATDGSPGREYKAAG